MPDVSPTTNHLTHDLSLTDGTNTLYFILADRRGKPTPEGWQKANNPRTSLRVSQGNEGYGDYELPFSSIVQSDFSGGRGARDFETDTTRYSDGYLADTARPRELRCGPRATLGTGTTTPVTFSPAGGSETATYTLGAQISTGSVPVASGAGTEISGLTVGNWYAIETTGGPWRPDGSWFNLDFTSYQVSNDAGASWSQALGTIGTPAVPQLLEPGMHLGLPSWGAYAEANGTHARLYFQATGTSIFIRTDDIWWNDNTGSLGWKLSAATKSDASGVGTFNPSFEVYARMTPGAMALRSIKLRVKTEGLTAAQLPVNYLLRIYGHDGANNRPDFTIKAAATVYKPAADADFVDLTFDIATTLLAATVYWVGVTVDPNGAPTIYDDFPKYQYATSSGDRIGTYDEEGAGWTTLQNNATFAMSLSGLTGMGSTAFFDYKGAKFAIGQPEDLSAPKLFVNGYIGMAASNASDKSKLNTGLTISESLTGKIVRVVEGPGNTEADPFRTITSNTLGANAVLSVSPNWNIEHTTDTMFVVLGCDSWQLITGHGITQPVTQRPLVVDETVYFPQGEATNIRRGKYSAGSWSWADDGSNKASFLALVQDDEGAQRIWRALAAAATVSEASKVAWGTDLTFDSTALACGTTASRITSLSAAKLGNGGMLPVVHKEDGFGGVAGTGTTKVFDWYRQFPEMREYTNGRTALQHDMYWWFNLMEGIERYYDQRLDDIGPNRDEGLPRGRRGEAACMLEYASQVYITVDGGFEGTSCVLRYNGTGWNEVYRANYGRRIRAISVQVIPRTSTPDRLWIADGEDLYWVPISLNPDQQAGYEYQTGTEWESAWIYGNYRDLKKYWDSLTIFAENLTTTTKVTAYYKVDKDTSWTFIGDYTSGPAQEIDIRTTGSATGQRIKIKLVLATADLTISPIVSAVRVNAMVRVEPKGTWNITALFTDGRSKDLLGVLDEMNAAETLHTLETWQNGNESPAPLATSFEHEILHAHRVVVDGVSAAPIDSELAPGRRWLTLLVSFTLIEV
jgi:hypothetical protein